MFVNCLRLLFCLLLFSLSLLFQVIRDSIFLIFVLYANKKKIIYKAKKKEEVILDHFEIDYIFVIQII